jgi:hypothetical protein
MSSLLQEFAVELRKPETRFIFQGSSDFATSLADEIDQLREHHKVAVDNWTLEAQTVKQQEDQLHEQRAEIERLRWAIDAVSKDRDELRDLLTVFINSSDAVPLTLEFMRRVQKALN